MTRFVCKIISPTDEHFNRHNQLIEQQQNLGYDKTALKIAKKQISTYLFFYAFPLIMFFCGVISSVCGEKAIPLAFILSGVPFFIIINRFEKHIFDIKTYSLYFKTFESKDSDWYKKGQRIKLLWVLGAYIMFFAGGFIFIGILILIGQSAVGVFN